MDETELYLRLAVALAIGLGVGLERGWKQRAEKSGERETGVRTFAILALVGFGVGIGVEELGAMFAAATALGVLAIVAIGYVRETWDEDGDRGATTEVAAFLTFVLGGLAGVGEVLAAGLVGVLLVALLDYKPQLHGFIQRVEKMELTAAVKLALVSIVLLPVLPNKGFGPGEVLNPYELWWAVVVIAALGFAGYAAIRIAGAQTGALLMGLVGGLVSSTGVAVNASRLSSAGKGAALPLAGAVAVAQGVMFVRTAVLVGILNAALLPHLTIALGAGAVAAAAGALILTWRAQKDGKHSKVDPGSPDALGSAIQFVIIVAVVLVAAYYAHQFAGDAGIALSGLLSGAVDVDAAVVSASRLAGAQLHTTSAQAAAFSVALATAANSVAKAGIAFRSGTREFAWPAIGVLLASGAFALLGFGAATLFAPAA